MGKQKHTQTYRRPNSQAFKQAKCAHTEHSTRSIQAGRQTYTHTEKQTGQWGNHTHQMLAAGQADKHAGRRQTNKHTYIQAVIYTHTYIHTYRQKKAEAYIQANITYIHTCIHPYIQTNNKFIHTGRGIHTHIHTYIHTYIQAYIHTGTHTEKRQAVRHIHIHTYIHTYIKTD